MTEERKSKIIFVQTITDDMEKEDPKFHKFIETVFNNTGVKLELLKDPDGRAILVEMYRLYEEQGDSLGNDG